MRQGRASLLIIIAFMLGSLIAVSPTPAPASAATPPSQTTTEARIVQYATDIQNGRVVTPWAGGAVPYSWGGGHGTTAGPTLGTCSGYTGSIQPCPAARTRGVDCSGFTRWVYRVAYGSDVLRATNTSSQLARMHRVTTPRPGDLVFFGTSTTRTTHVGVYIGNGRMINAPRTGANVRTDSTSRSNLLGYWRL